MANESNIQADELLAEAGHELRTPLNAILGMLELSFDEPLTDELRDYLGTAYHSAQRLQVVLELLADLARARRGDLELTAAPFELRRTIERAVATTETEARARGVRLRVRVNPDVPDKVQGDARCLERIVTTLIDHALRTTNATEVTIHLALASQPAQTIELVLGVGKGDVAEPLRPGHLKSVVSADSNGDRYHPRGWLALAVVEQRSRLLGGGLWIDPDDPTRWYCTMQLQPPGAHRPVPRVADSLPETVPKRGGTTDAPLNVLVVDDTPANQKVVQAILTRRGHDVQLADNGRQAVDQVRSNPFDVVLMDAQMPVMNGLEAARSIRDFDDLARAELPIIAMSANTTPNDRQQCLAAGMNDYLPKPIGAATLIAAVEFYGNSRTVAAPAAALDRVGGDRALWHEMIRLFQEDSPGLLEKIRAGLQSGDSESVARAAHSLKSLAANFDATPTVNAAQAIERLAGSRDLRELAPSLARLESELALLQETLAIHTRRIS